MSDLKHADRNEIAKGFADDILKIFGDKIQNVILFGSVARGESDEESDIDILVITTEEDFRIRRELIGMAFQILSKHIMIFLLRCYRKGTLMLPRIYHS
ncbi:MAG: nucleotidyltransferase domain-containing protein [Methanosarcinales archaeon]|uniref:Nucleotidyltransferase domain-containing protein n=1 Tax=Candidatus Ethanoperedens thermophilum TaxID=2766897 RepID=A0A848DBB4_9EURY|nr:nucleotidyltransferase domain-containing protein [Candidatus Ethanoperedens thermophilum]